jgi:hypothetical protein
MDGAVAHPIMVEREGKATAHGELFDVEGEFIVTASLDGDFRERVAGVAILALKLVRSGRTSLSR